MISAAEFAAYNREVAKIGDRAAADVESSVLSWCRSHDGATVAQKREAAKLIMEGFVQGYDDVAAEFAAQWYDHRAEQGGARLEQAVTMTTYRPDAVDAVARYQAKKLAKGGDAEFAKACGEFARNDAFRSLNETISSNVGRDKEKGARFARVPTGFETCTFCLMLASRGAVYHTRKAAGEFRHFHRRCDCKVVPSFEDDADAELVEGVRPKELYERYKDDAYRLACLITGSRTDGEDLAQEAFVTCAQSIKSLRDGSKFRPWLLKTLSRAAWKYCRKAKRETPVSEFFDAGESESALSAVLRTDEQRRLYAALDTLDEKRRVTVVLYYFDDRSVREIAQATGVTEGTVKSRLFSARRHLRQALTEERKPKEAANHG